MRAGERERERGERQIECFKELKGGVQYLKEETIVLVEEEE